MARKSFAIRLSGFLCVKLGFYHFTSDLAIFFATITFTITFSMTSLS